MRMSVWALALLALGCETGGSSSTAAAPAATATASSADTAQADDAADPPDPGGSGAALTYARDIQPIYAQYCGECHSGETAEGCPGMTCFVDFYETLPKPSYSCVPMTKAQCGLKRITETAANPGSTGFNGKNGPIVLKPDEIQKVRDWIELGMPER